MVLLDVALSVVATVAITVLLMWVKNKRQAMPAATRSDAVDTLLALAFVILLLLPLGMLTAAIMPAFGDGPIALLAGALLYAASVAATFYGIGRSNSVDAGAANPNT
jgi:hypothetical protein